MPGPPGVTKRSPLVPILLVLVLVAAGVGAYVALSGDDGGSGPEAVANRYFEAAIDGDCAALVDTVVLAGQTREEAITECQGWMSEAGLGGGDVPDELAAEMPTELVSTTVDSETDTDATVSLEYRTQGGSTETEQVHLVNGDGGWRVDIDGSSGVTADGDTGSTAGDVGTTAGDSGSGDSGDSGVATGTAPPTDSAEAQASPELVDLANDCAAGDMTACDNLYFGSELGGELEAYAMTCGGRASSGDVQGDCDTLYG